ncbi:MAG: ATP-binding protein, partial [Candidatus Sumerlaeota bacterium]
QKPEAASDKGLYLIEPKPLPKGWQSDFSQRARMQRARIPKRFQNKTFDSFRTEKSTQRKNLVKMAKMYVDMFCKNEDFQKGLILQGAVGCGKTHLAVAILETIIDRGYSGLYYNMPDLLMDIRRTYDDNSDLSEAELLADLVGPDLLVLDDLGAEKTAGWVNDRLYLIVNRRYEECKPILVTTNLAMDELIDKLGERTVSRLCEASDYCDTFPKQDYRRMHMR